MSHEVKELFLAYEKANSSSDTATITDLYASTFMFGGINGVQAVKRDDFLKALPRMKAHLSAFGLLETQLANVEVNPISAKFLLAQVKWRMKVESLSGGKYVDAFATYILMHGEDEILSIVFQIDHQDLASLITDQQS